MKRPVPSLFALIAALSASSAAMAQSPDALPALIPFDTEVKKIGYGKPYPFRKAESAYCCVTFDVDETGRQRNVEAGYCTDPGFAKNAVKTVKSWKLSPARFEGEPVYRSGMTTAVSHIAFSNMTGIRPGRDGYMERRDPEAFLPRRPVDPAGRFAWANTHFDSEQTCPRERVDD